MPDTKGNVYADTQTWNPFKGCRFNCVYCGPTFQRQSKRQMHSWDKCYNYEPNCHEDQLASIADMGNAR